MTQVLPDPADPDSIRRRPLLEIKNLEVAFQTQTRVGPRASRRRPHPHARPHGGHRGRVRVRQVHHRSRDHQPASRHGEDHRRRGALRGPGPVQAEREADGGGARAPHRVRPAGPDVQPQPGVEHRLPGGGGDPRQRDRDRQGRQEVRHPGAQGSRARRRRQASAAVPAPVLRRHAAARTHRHGVVLPAEAAHRRRADVGAGCDGAARDPRPPRDA